MPNILRSPPPDSFVTALIAEPGLNREKATATVDLDRRQLLVNALPNRLGSMVQGTSCSRTVRYRCHPVSDYDRQPETLTNESLRDGEVTVPPATPTSLENISRHPNLHDSKRGNSSAARCAVGPVFLLSHSAAMVLREPTSPTITFKKSKNHRVRPHRRAILHVWSKSAPDNWLLCSHDLTISSIPLWCSWLSRSAVKDFYGYRKVTGSIPVEGTNYVAFFHFSCSL